MSVREVRVSPEGDAVAIRSDWPADAWNAWGVMHAINGGHWCDTNAVSSWSVAGSFTAPTQPEPENPPAPPPPAPEPEPEP
jgi:hypothetical protein